MGGSDAGNWRARFLTANVAGMIGAANPKREKLRAPRIRASLGESVAWCAASKLTLASSRSLHLCSSGSTVVSASLSATPHP